jgi:alpha-glucosidase
MRLSILFGAFMLAAVAAQAAGPVLVNSPDGAVQVTVAVNAQGQPTYAVRYRQAELLRPSSLGLQLASADLTQGLKLTQADKVTAVADDYQLVTDKRANCRYRANRRVVHFAGKAGTPTLSVVFQVSNDGVAFQYLIEGKSADVQRITAEKTSFHLPIRSLRTRSITSAELRPVRRPRLDKAGRFRRCLRQMGAGCCSPRRG